MLTQPARRRQRQTSTEAENNEYREKKRISAMRAAGITVTDDEEIHIIETAHARVIHCQEEVDRLKHRPA